MILNLVYVTIVLYCTCRTGIETGTLNEVEDKYVHPQLKASIEGDDSVLITDGIGS
jgi:hypothetical protein